MKIKFTSGRKTEDYVSRYEYFITHTTGQLARFIVNTAPHFLNFANFQFKRKI